ncbi:MAG: FAD:protein FMN transferase [Erythrobacter sp.]|jgi:thiamine biosynthesis lipoprotein|nr:FAD:protein FMN transferase [Erythrobacter sp.]
MNLPLRPAPILLIPPDVPDDAQPTPGREMRFEGAVFGTTWSLTVLRRAASDPAHDAAFLAQIVRACGQALDLIDAQMSLWRPASDIVRFNALAPGERMRLPEPFSIVLAKAHEIAKLTEGAFNPGLGEAAAQWGFGALDLADPVASGLAFAAKGGRGPALCETREGGIVKQDGLAIDLNGIAKGYAVDLLCDLVRSHPDTASCLVEIGGELKGFGTRGDAMPFWTDIAADGDAAKATHRAALFGWACATSGEAERCHRTAHGTFSHILDPESRAPVRSDLVGASVFDRECARADALATAFVVMGEEKALAFADDHVVPCILAPRAGGRPILSRAMERWVDHG